MINQTLAMSQALTVILKVSIFAACLFQNVRINAWSGAKEMSAVLYSDDDSLNGNYYTL